MKIMKTIKLCCSPWLGAIALLAVSACTSQFGTARAQTTAFTYQGRLNDGSGPVNGSYDLTFTLLTTNVAGSAIAGPVTNSATAVTNGLFTTIVDFGAGVFTGGSNWLEIAVRTSGGSSFTTLTPRQQITPTPYAIFATTAGNLGGTLPSSQLSGLIPNGTLPANPNFVGLVTANAFAGNGSALTLLSANNLATGLVPLAQLGEITANQLNSATWQLATNLNGGNAALASNVVSGIGLTNAFITNSIFAGDGGGLTNINASQLGGGTIPLAQLPNVVLTNNQASVQLTGSFTGNGAGLTNLNASVGININAGSITTGTLADSELSPNVALRSGGNTFAGAQVFNGTLGINTASTPENDFSINSDTYLFSHALFLRGETGTDHNHGLAYCGPGFTNFSPAVLPDGPVLWGYAGGALGVKSGGPQAVLGWNPQGIYVNGTISLPGYATIYAGSTPVFHADLFNFAAGLGAGYLSGLGNTACGNNALASHTGSGNIGLGNSAGNSLTTGNNNIYIGNPGTSSESGIIRIGTPGVQTATYIAGTVSVPALTITGGADLAEPFKITSGDREVRQGAVVVIDEQNPGRLKLSDIPYDTRVAGVVSGANGINPGIQMHQQGLMEGGKNVALTGRVYVLAEASDGAIKPGDLLTTSSTPGRAMRASDHVRAQGAILGKAMTALKEGNGMVLVLVTLQ